MISEGSYDTEVMMLKIQLGHLNITVFIIC